MSSSLLERYRSSLPLSDSTPLVSLGEGSTPLVRAERLSERLGLDLWLKWEGANPTGSFKDRGMAVAVSKALEAGAPGVVCASTGNTAASAAAYAARAGIEAVVVHAAGAVAVGKLVQVRAAGARLLPVDGTFEDAFAAALKLAEDEGYAFVNSTNPHRLEGQKTAAFELLEQLGAPPDVLALPYGGGGNTAAYFKGFTEAPGPTPRFVPVQAAARATTVASAIRIGDPVHAHEVAEARAGGGALLRAGVRRVCRRACARLDPSGQPGRLRPDRPRAEGHRQLRRADRLGMKLRVRAPATTANLGPGFDCAAAALELWNEVEVTDAVTTWTTSRSGRSRGWPPPRVSRSPSPTGSHASAGSAPAPRPWRSDSWRVRSSPDAVLIRRSCCGSASTWRGIPTTWRLHSPAASA